MILAITSFLAGPFGWVARWLALAALAVSLVGYGYVKGSEHGQDRIDVMVGKSATEGIRIVKARDTVTTVIQEKWLPQITREHVVTETITKEVAVYVPSTDPDLSAGFRVLHDAAATGRIPDPASVRDAAPVSAQDATRIVTENYGSCRADQAKLSELQEWIREQQKVK